MGLKGKILKYMSDISKEASVRYFLDKLYTQAKSSSGLWLAKRFFLNYTNLYLATYYLTNVYLNKVQFKFEVHSGNYIFF